MLEYVKKTVLDITRRSEAGEISNQDAAQQLTGVLGVLQQMEKAAAADLKQIKKIEKNVVEFINVAGRVYDPPIK